MMSVIVTVIIVQEIKRGPNSVNNQTANEEIFSNRTKRALLTSHLITQALPRDKRSGDEEWEDAEINFKKTKTLGMFLLGKKVTYFKETSERTHWLLLQWELLRDPLVAVESCRADLGIVLDVVLDKSIRKTYHRDNDMLQTQINSHTQTTYELGTAAELMRELLRKRENTGARGDAPPRINNVIPFHDFTWVIFHAKALKQAVEKLTDILNILAPRYQDYNWVNSVSQRSLEDTTSQAHDDPDRKTDAGAGRAQDERHAATSRLDGRDHSQARAGHAGSLAGDRDLTPRRPQTAGNNSPRWEDLGHTSHDKSGLENGKSSTDTDSEGIIDDWRKEVNRYWSDQSRSQHDSSDIQYDNFRTIDTHTSEDKEDQDHSSSDGEEDSLYMTALDIKEEDPSQWMYNSILSGRYGEYSPVTPATPNEREGSPAPGGYPLTPFRGNGVSPPLAGNVPLPHERRNPGVPEESSPIRPYTPSRSFREAILRARRVLSYDSPDNQSPRGGGSQVERRREGTMAGRNEANQITAEQLEAELRRLFSEEFAYLRQRYANNPERYPGLRELERRIMDERPQTAVIEELPTIGEDQAGRGIGWTVPDRAQQQPAALPPPQPPPTRPTWRLPRRQLTFRTPERDPPRETENSGNDASRGETEATSEEDEEEERRDESPRPQWRDSSAMADLSAEEDELDESDKESEYDSQEEDDEPSAAEESPITLRAPSPGELLYETRRLTRQQAAETGRRPTTITMRPGSRLRRQAGTEGTVEETSEDPGEYSSDYEDEEEDASGEGSGDNEQLGGGETVNRPDAKVPTATGVAGPDGTKDTNQIKKENAKKVRWATFWEVYNNLETHVTRLRALTTELHGIASMADNKRIHPALYRLLDRQGITMQNDREHSRINRVMYLDAGMALELKVLAANKEDQAYELLTFPARWRGRNFRIVTEQAKPFAPNLGGRVGDLGDCARIPNGDYRCPSDFSFKMDDCVLATMQDNATRIREECDIEQVPDDETPFVTSTKDGVLVSARGARKTVIDMGQSNIQTTPVHIKNAEKIQVQYNTGSKRVSARVMTYGPRFPGNQTRVETWKYNVSEIDEFLRVGQIERHLLKVRDFIPDHVEELLVVGTALITVTTLVQYLVYLCRKSRSRIATCNDAEDGEQKQNKTWMNKLCSWIACCICSQCGRKEKPDNPMDLGAYRVSANRASRNRRRNDSPSGESYSDSQYSDDPEERSQVRELHSQRSREQMGYGGRLKKVVFGRSGDQETEEEVDLDRYRRKQRRHQARAGYQEPSCPAEDVTRL